MDYREGIEAKVKVIFQITEQFLSGQVPLEEAKEQLNSEMVRIRPAQFEAVKLELGKRLKEAEDHVKSEKLLGLFKNYLSLPYTKLDEGHPLKNYYEENSRARACLVRIDEMEGEEVSLEDWKNIYEIISQFIFHIKRQEKNFYPLMIPLGMRLQVEKAKEAGEVFINEISKNQELLKSGEHIDFLFNQRSLTQVLMNYLDIEERMLYPKALASLTKFEFEDLRKVDDMEGYVYIEQPVDFNPKENTGSFSKLENYNHNTGTLKEETGKGRSDLGLLLPALLAARGIGIVYYTLSGEVVFVAGNQILEMDLQISEDTRHELLKGIKKIKKFWYSQVNRTFLITYSLVMDSLGKSQGILKTKEDISEIKALIGECLEGRRTEKVDTSMEKIRKENRSIDSAQNISELFLMYPGFKIDFFSLDEELKGFEGAMGMEILKEATVGMLAKSLRLHPDDLVDKINRLLESY